MVTVRYFAAARTAAGLPGEYVDISDGATVADALDAIVRRHGDAAAQGAGRLQRPA